MMERPQVQGTVAAGGGGGASGSQVVTGTCFLMILIGLITNEKRNQENRLHGLELMSQLSQVPHRLYGTIGPTWLHC